MGVLIAPGGRAPSPSLRKTRRNIFFFASLTPVPRDLVPYATYPAAWRRERKSSRTRRARWSPCLELGRDAHVGAVPVVCVRYCGPKAVVTHPTSSILLSHHPTRMRNTAASLELKAEKNHAHVRSIVVDVQTRPLHKANTMAANQEVIDIDADAVSLDTTMQVYDVHHSLSQAGWKGQQQETTSTVPQETMGTEAAAAATPPQHSCPPFNYPPSYEGCSKSIYCGRPCLNGKHIGPGACKLVEPPAGYVTPLGFKTYEQDYARINGNKGRKRKSEGTASPEAAPRVAPAPQMAASGYVTMASLAPQQSTGAPGTASEEEDASDTAGSDEGRQQSGPQAKLAADLKRQCERLTAENRHLVARLDTMEEDLKVFKKRLVAAILQA